MISRKGAWYSYNGENISQGRENAIKYLEENLVIAQEVQGQVRQKLEMGAVVSANSVRGCGSGEEPVEMELEAE